MSMFLLRFCKQLIVDKARRSTLNYLECFLKRKIDRFLPPHETFDLVRRPFDLEQLFRFCQVLFL